MSDCDISIVKTEAMEPKAIKEEIQDKEYAPAVSVDNVRRINKNSAGGKDRGMTTPPEGEEGRERSPGSGLQQLNGAISPNHNGSVGSVTPPLSLPPSLEVLSATGPQFGARPPLHKLRRFLSTLVQFGCDISPEVGDRVRGLVHALVTATMSVEEFQTALQEATNYPLRSSVPPFLRALVPHAQREVLAAARHSKQTPLQYIRCHEHIIFEVPYASGEPTDIFLGPSALPAGPSAEAVLKRRASDPFYETSISHTNGSHQPGGASDIGDYPPPSKRHHPSAFLINPSPLLFPLHAQAHLFDYPHPYHSAFHAGHSQADFLSNVIDRGGREQPSSSSSVGRDQGSYSEQQRSGAVSGGTFTTKHDDEWKNINTMLNCILSMVEKTKRALAILQQRGSALDICSSADGSDIKRMASEIMASTVRQTEERVADVRRRAEDAVNQVKRQAVIELQRAVSAAESKALELVAAERVKMERLLSEARKHGAAQGEDNAQTNGSRDGSPSPSAQPSQNSCWNCGRKAQETCSGCNAARYCSSFCQHKDWENHHQVCCGRDTKPLTTLTTLTTSPPQQPAIKIRASTPVSSSSTATESRLTLPTINNAQDRPLSLTGSTQNPSGERIGLSALIGGKK